MAEDFNITIPEYEKAGETPISVLNKILLHASLAHEKIKETHFPNPVLNSPLSFFIKIGDLFLQIAHTFTNIVNHKSDAVSAYSLCRMQADYLASMLLIYDNDNEEEVIFRYLLYFLDGLRTRSKSVEAIPEYDGRISREDYDNLKKQMTFAKYNADEGIKFCINELNRLSFKNICTEGFDNIVNLAAWKYTTFPPIYRSGKVKQFSWHDLYFRIDNRENICNFISLCSQYVHGLPNAFFVDNSISSFHPIASFEIMLLDKYLYLLRKLFGEEYVNELLKKELLDFCHNLVDRIIQKI